MSLTDADVALNERRVNDYTGQERFNGRNEPLTITQLLSKTRRKSGDRKALKMDVLETVFQSIVAHITYRYGTDCQPRAFTDVSIC